MFHDKILGVMWVPIETWMVAGGGVPDSWFAAPGGVSGWVEYKKYPNRPTPEQAAFLSRAVRLGTLDDCVEAARTGRAPARLPKWLT